MKINLKLLQTSVALHKLEPGTMFKFVNNSNFICLKLDSGKWTILHYFKNLGNDVSKPYQVLSHAECALTIPIGTLEITE